MTAFNGKKKMQNKSSKNASRLKRAAPFFILLFSLIIVLTPSVSAQQTYRGLPLELFQPLILAATLLLGLMLWKCRTDPAIGIVCAIFWIFLAFAINKIAIYTGNCEKITYMDAYLLTWLFGGVAAFCVIYTIYYAFLFTKDAAKFIESPNYEGRG